MIKSITRAALFSTVLVAGALPSAAALVTYTAEMSGFTHNSDVVLPAFTSALGGGYTHLSFAGASSNDGASYSSAVTFSTKVGTFGGSNTSEVNFDFGLGEIGPRGTWDGILSIAFTQPVSVVGFGLVIFNTSVETIRVYSASNALLGTFNNQLSDSFSLWGVAGTAGEQIGRVELDGNFFAIQDISFNGVSSAIPEPATWAMMLVGFAGLGYAARRRREAEAAA